MSLLAPQSSRPVPVVASPPTGVPVDPVTGLGTRARLMADLNALHAGAPPTGANMLAAFALDGLSDYEREHGQAQGGELLGRLAGRLAQELLHLGRRW
jgi:GGDEF domain-containing protein